MRLSRCRLRGARMSDEWMPDQRSLNRQLADVWAYATAQRMYDAADFIANHIDFPIDSDDVKRVPMRPVNEELEDW